jgi:hypothetical protein
MLRFCCLGQFNSKMTSISSLEPEYLLWKTISCVGSWRVLMPTPDVLNTPWISWRIYSQPQIATEIQIWAHLCRQLPPMFLPPQASMSCRWPWNPFDPDWGKSFPLVAQQTASDKFKDLPLELPTGGRNYVMIGATTIPFHKRSLQWLVHTPLSNISCSHMRSLFSSPGELL